MPNADRKPASTRKAGDEAKAAQPARKAAKSAGLRADGTPRRSNHRDKPAPRRAPTSRDGDFDRYGADSRATGGRAASTGRTTTGRTGTTGTTGRTSTTGRTGTTGTGRTTTARSTTGTGRTTAGRVTSAGTGRTTAAGTGRTTTGRTSVTGTSRTTTGRPTAGTARTGTGRATAGTGRDTTPRATGRASGDGARAAGTARAGGRPITSTGRNVGGRGATGGDVWGSPRAAAGAKGAGTASKAVKKTAVKKTAAKAAKPVAAPAPKRVRPPSATVSVRKPTDRPDAEVTPGELERLQKVLAQAGIGSRRASEELIAAGRVTVDGVRAELGDRVDAVNSVIHVDGERIVTDDRKVYLAMNKPAGVVATMADEKGRAALADFLGNVPQRVYHVGRLDSDSEGLLLLTNDGTLAHKLMHPSYNVPKTYLAEVPGPVRTGLRKQLMEGVELEDGPVAVDGFRLVDSLGGRVLVELVLHEGRKHVVRRMMAEVGHPVSRLVRTSIGPIKLGDLKAGRTRRLTRPEIAALFKVVGD